MKDYYLSELNRALEKADSEYYPSVRVFGDNTYTNQLNLTNDCIDTLIAVLTKLKNSDAQKLRESQGKEQVTCKTLEK